MNVIKAKADHQPHPEVMNDVQAPADEVFDTQVMGRRVEVAPLSHEPPRKTCSLLDTGPVGLIYSWEL